MGAAEMLGVVGEKGGGTSAIYNFQFSIFKQFQNVENCEIENSLKIGTCKLKIKCLLAWNPYLGYWNFYPRHF